MSTDTVRPRGAAWWLAPLRPALIGMAALAVVMVIAARQLPDHAILVWAGVGKKGLAAARSDIEIVVLLTSLGIIGLWVVASALLAFLPAKHVLVPHAAYWKTGGRDRIREMRHRFAVYLSRIIGITFWFLAAEVVVAIVTQKDGLLETPWLPVIVSVVYLVGLLVFAVWAFADGFQPPSRGSKSPPGSTGSTGGSGSTGRRRA